MINVHKKDVEPSSSLFLDFSLMFFLRALSYSTCLSIFSFFFQMYRFSHRLRGICSLPINSRVLTDGTLISGSFIDRSGGKKELPEDDEETLVSVLKKTVTEEDIVNENGGLRLEYEIDYEEEDFEITQMPQLSHGIYLHDFKVVFFLTLFPIFFIDELTKYFSGQ